VIALGRYIKVIGNHARIARKKKTPVIGGVYRRWYDLPPDVVQMSSWFFPPQPSASCATSASVVGKPVSYAPDRVVVPSPLLCDHLASTMVSKDLSIQQSVSEFVVR